MGMSSSQARLLSITARQHDIEYAVQKMESKKLQLANESDKVYETYLNALQSTKLQYDYTTSMGETYTKDASLKGLENGFVGESGCCQQPMFLTSIDGTKLYVTPEVNDAYKLDRVRSYGNLNAYLEDMFGDSLVKTQETSYNFGSIAGKLQGNSLGTKEVKYLANANTHSPITTTTYNLNDFTSTASIEISTASELLEIAKEINDGTIPNNVNITLKEGATLDFTGFGVDGNALFKGVYRGIFNGNGATIKGLNKAVFNVLTDSAKVYNLNVDGSNIKLNSSARGSYGILANGSNGLISDCTISNSKLSYQGTTQDVTLCLGGIVGSQDGGIIQNSSIVNSDISCMPSGTASSSGYGPGSKTYVGGVAGKCNAGSTRSNVTVDDVEIDVNLFAGDSVNGSNGKILAGAIAGYTTDVDGVQVSHLDTNMVNTYGHYGFYNSDNYADDYFPVNKLGYKKSSYDLNEGSEQPIIVLNKTLSLNNYRKLRNGEDITSPHYTTRIPKDKEIANNIKTAFELAGYSDAASNFMDIQFFVSNKIVSSFPDADGTFKLNALASVNRRVCEYIDTLIKGEFATEEQRDFIDSLYNSFDTRSEYKVAVKDYEELTDSDGTQSIYECVGRRPYSSEVVESLYTKANVTDTSNIVIPNDDIIANNLYTAFAHMTCMNDDTDTLIYNKEETYNKIKAYVSNLVKTTGEGPGGVTGRIPDYASKAVINNIACNYANYPENTDNTDKLKKLYNAIFVSGSPTYIPGPSSSDITYTQSSDGTTGFVSSNPEGYNKITMESIDMTNSSVQKAVTMYELGCKYDNIVVIGDGLANNTEFITNMVRNAAGILITVNPSEFASYDYQYEVYKTGYDEDDYVESKNKASEEIAKVFETEDVDVATSLYLSEVTNNTEITKAQQKYENDMNRIHRKEQKIDTTLAALESERSSLTTEQGSLETVIKDNVSMNFKLFS